MANRDGPPFGLRKSLIAFRVILALVTFAEGASAGYYGFRSSVDSRLGSVIAWVAAVQAVAGLLLLWPQLTVLAAIPLLLIFAFLLVVQGPVGNLSLLVYGAGLMLLLLERDK